MEVFALIYLQINRETKHYYLVDTESLKQNAAQHNTKVHAGKQKSSYTWDPTFTELGAIYRNRKFEHYSVKCGAGVARSV
jgi:hypothetical protein